MVKRTPQKLVATTLLASLFLFSIFAIAVAQDEAIVSVKPTSYYQALIYQFFKPQAVSLRDTTYQKGDWAQFRMIIPIDMSKCSALIKSYEFKIQDPATGKVYQVTNYNLPTPVACIGLPTITTKQGGKAGFIDTEMSVKIQSDLPAGAQMEFIVSQIRNENGANVIFYNYAPGDKSLYTDVFTVTGGTAQPGNVGTPGTLIPGSGGTPLCKVSCTEWTACSGGTQQRNCINSACSVGSPEVRSCTQTTTTTGGTPGACATDSDCPSGQTCVLSQPPTCAIVTQTTAPPVIDTPATNKLPWIAFVFIAAGIVIVLGGIYYFRK